MSQEFQPSSQARTAKEEALARLAYVCKAAQYIEAAVKQDGPPPDWVMERLFEAASSMGMAYAFIHNSKTRKVAKP